MGIRVSSFKNGVFLPASADKSCDSASSLGLRNAEARPDKIPHAPPNRLEKSRGPPIASLAGGACRMPHQDWRSPPPTNYEPAQPG